MEIPHIVVTYPVKTERRFQVKSQFGQDARICFLEDLDQREREQELRGADVLMSWNLTRELKTREVGWLRKLHLLQVLSAGADQVPFRDLPKSTVVASNIGAYSEPIAEHVLAMTLALSKNLFREHLKLAQGEFDQTRNRMLRGGICGVLGFGGIGKATARLMRALGMKIHALNTTGHTAETVEFIGTLNDLRQVLSAAEVVVLSLPLTRATRGLIGRRELEWMKADAILVNVSRGDVIDEAALYDHLASHPDFRAGIDTWWIEPFREGVFRTSYPFFTLPNIIGSPHNAGLVPGMDAEATRQAVENVKRFLAGKQVAGLVRREDYV